MSEHYLHCLVLAFLTRLSWLLHVAVQPIGSAHAACQETNQRGLSPRPNCQVSGLVCGGVHGEGKHLGSPNQYSGMGKRGRSRKAVVATPTRHVCRVDVKLPAHAYEQIRRIVSEGSFFSMADFARTAIREKLGKDHSAKNASG